MAALPVIALKPAGIWMPLAPRPGTGPVAVQVRSDCLLAFREPWVNAGRRRRLVKPPSNQKGAGFSGQSQSNLKRCIDLFFQLSETQFIYNPITHTRHQFTAAVITLTIPTAHLISRKRANYNLLPNFLQWLRRQGGVYVWKAEQTQRGQVHYHLVYSRFVAHDAVRKEWNKVLKANGLLDAYARQHGHYHAPSSEVKGVRDKSELSRYLQKYVVKSGPTPAGGRVWGCSRELSAVRYFTFYEEEAPDFLINREAKLYEEFTVFFDVKPSDLPLNVRVNYDNWRSIKRSQLNF